MKAEEKQANRQLKRGALISYVNIGTTIIVSLLYTPYLLRMLGQNEFGLFSLAFSVIGTFAILDFGMGNANIRYTAKYRNEGDRNREFTLHGMFLLIYSLVGILALILGIWLYFNVDVVFSKKMTITEIAHLKTMLLFIVPYVALSLPLSVFISIIQGYERFVFNKTIAFLNIIMIPIVSVVILMAGYRSVVLVAAIVLINISFRLIRVFYCFGYLKIRFSFKGFSKKLFKEIFTYSVYIFLGVLAWRLTNNSGQLILGIVSGTEQIAIYAIGVTLFIQFRTLPNAIRSLLLPVLTRIEKSENESQKYNAYFVAVGRIQFYVLALFYIGFVIYGKQFIALWAGPGYEMSYFVCLFLISAALFSQIQGVANTILQAQNKHQFVSVLAFVISVLSIGLGVIMAINYGAIGVALAFMLFNIIGVVIRNIYFARTVKLDVRKFWVQIFKIIPSFILPVVFSVLYVHFYNAETWLNLAIGATGFLGLYVLSVVLFSFNKFEKRLVILPLKTHLNRIVNGK